MGIILLTGFEPFGGNTINPSQAVALALHDEMIAGKRVVGAVLPCVFGEAITRLKQLLRAHRPELVVCLGVAGGRAAITPERVAINVDDARIPDNIGQQPSERAIVPGGPTAYWSTLPIKAIVQRLQSENIPAEISQTAGTYVCNHLFYGLMHKLKRQRPPVRGGFIHIPPPSAMPVEQEILAIRLALEVSVPQA